MSKKFKMLLAGSLVTFGFYKTDIMGVSDQQKQNAYGIYRSLVNSSRAAYLLYTSVKDYQISLKNIQYNSQQYHKARHQVHMRVAKSILELSKNNRGIYLKLGQYIGNLQRVVPWQFTQVLKVLQDSAPPISFKEIRVVIENDLQRNADDIFSNIDENAIAAASLAQVHKATLKQNGQQVALKVQYPFLREQSRCDLFVLQKITKICNYLLKGKQSQLDLLRLFTTWTDTLKQQLDFGIQLKHAQTARSLFKQYPYIAIPHYYKELCSDRLLVMQFMRGVKINQKQEMQAMGISPSKVSQNLIKIVTDMIFKHGFVHCDAHPGNILVRKANNKLGHQILLLDHGLYRSIDKEIVRNFSGLWVSLVLQDKQKVLYYSNLLNIHEHIQYLPLIFLYRSRNSTKKIGAGITPQQRKQLRQKDLANFDSISNILQDLPPELMFIIRASNLVGTHNINLGGTHRTRLFGYTKGALGVLNPTKMGYFWGYLVLVLRVWLFETFPYVYRRLFGVLSS